MWSITSLFSVVILYCIFAFLVSMYIDLFLSLYIFDSTMVLMPLYQGFRKGFDLNTPLLNSSCFSQGANIAFPSPFMRIFLHDSHIPLSALWSRPVRSHCQNVKEGVKLRKCPFSFNKTRSLRQFLCCGIKIFPLKLKIGILVFSFTFHFYLKVLNLPLNQ